MAKIDVIRLIDKFGSILFRLGVNKNYHDLFIKLRMKYGI
jgi:hypothetical protein